VLRQCVGFLEGQGLVQWWGLILDFSSIGKSNGLRFGASLCRLSVPVANFEAETWNMKTKKLKFFGFSFILLLATGWGLFLLTPDRSVQK
jgi:hypothetical protein